MRQYLLLLISSIIFIISSPCFSQIPRPQQKSKLIEALDIANTGIVGARKTPSSEIAKKLNFLDLAEQAIQQAKLEVFSNFRLQKPNVITNLSKLDENYFKNRNDIKVYFTLLCRNSWSKLKEILGKAMPQGSMNRTKTYDGLISSIHDKYKKWVKTGTINNTKQEKDMSYMHFLKNAKENITAQNHKVNTQVLNAKSQAIAKKKDEIIQALTNFNTSITTYLNEVGIVLSPNLVFPEPGKQIYPPLPTHVPCSSKRN